jgi:hypothetical protein
MNYLPFPLSLFNEKFLLYLMTVAFSSFHSKRTNGAPFYAVVAGEIQSL